MATSGRSEFFIDLAEGNEEVIDFDISYLQVAPEDSSAASEIHLKTAWDKKGNIPANYTVFKNYIYQTNNNNVIERNSEGWSFKIKAVVQNLKLIVRK